MKSLYLFKWNILSAIIITGLAMMVGSASAATLGWAGGASSNAPANGNWDTTTANMWANSAGAGNSAWTQTSATSANTPAVFGGANGITVNVATGVAATTMTFLNSYTLTSSVPETIQYNAGAGAFIFTNGATVTIGTNVTLVTPSGGGTTSFGSLGGTGTGGTLTIQNGGKFQCLISGNGNSAQCAGVGTVVNVQTGGQLVDGNTIGSPKYFQFGVNSGDNVTVNVNGGTVSCPGNAGFMLGAGASSTATLNLNSGAVTLGSGTAALLLANGATSFGTNNLNGGTETVVQVAKGSGTTAVFNLNGGTLTVAASTSASTFMQGLTAANVRNTGSTINNGGFSTTIGQPLLHSTISGDNATDGGLTFAGAGVTTSSGANTYNGPTAVSSGKFVTTTASTGAGSYSVADGAVLEVQVTASGASLANSSLTLGTSGNVTNNFTLNANGSTTIPAVAVSGALNLNGAVNVTVTGSGLTGPNTYLLMSYGSQTSSGSFVAGSLPAVAGYVATLTNNTSAKQLQLVYIAAPQAVKWAVGNGNWDTATKNWQLLAGSVLTNYNEGSLAAFDDSASGSSPITVTLAANRSPGGITNNSSAINYILAGGASINGGTTITKNGSSTLTIDDSGPNVLSAVTINGGALQLGTNDANGDLGSAVVTNNGTLIFDRTDNPTSANLISGSGSLVQNGSGILTVTTANTYSNLTVVNSGQLVLANGSAVQNSTVSNNVANGIGFSGFTTATIGGLSGTGNITLTNAAGAAVTVVSGGNNQSTAYGGTFTGGGTLQQAGTGVLTLSGNSVLNTLQVINGGTVSIAGGISTNANLQITTVNGGTLSLSGGNTTVTTDSRIGVANGVWNVSGNAILNLSKLVLGSASSANVNNVMTVSGNAVVNQNQTGSSGQLWIGGNNGGSGSLVLKDFAVWTNSVAADVEVGRGVNGGTGVFTITNNATFFFNNVINVAQNASGAGALGTVNLSGGTVCVTGFVNGSGNGGTINANGGTITALATSANFFSNFTGAGGTNSVNLQSGGLGFNLNGNAVTIGNSLSGAGGLSVMGGGTLTLTASNSYTGATYVGNSTLILPGSASIAAGTGLSLTNATLQFAVTGNALTNFVTGTFSTPGLPSTINISSFAGSGTPPFPITIIKYTTGVGLVDGGNNLTNLTLASLASATPQGDLTGYLTNNAVKHSIDLVITGGTITPQFTTQPAPISRYAGRTAQFTALASGATGYQWQTNLVNVLDGGNLSGSATTTLTITNVSAANATSYDVVATNVAGSATSSSASLTIVTPDCAYEGAIVSNNPVAYYRFNETGDPINTQNLPAYDFAGGYDGVYGATVLNVTYGINGPQPGTGYPGFDNGNGAAQFTPGTAYANTSLITVSNGLPVVTNTMTLLGWVYPLGAETNFDGLIFSRGGTNVLGLGYSSSTDGNGNYTLGYTWNNDANTYNWNSGLVPPQNQWSMVALVVTPTNATIYIGNTNGLVSSVHTYAHVMQSLGGIITIGDDRSTGSAGSRIFNGNMDEVSVFNQALTQGQVLNVLGAAVGTTNFPPAIVSQPASQTAVVADNIQLTVGVAGTPTLSYQWQVGTNGVYVNLADGGQFSGSQTPILSVSSLVLTDPTNYIVVVTNSFGSVTSSPASLTILASRPVVTLLASDAPGSSSFNTAGNWSDSNVPNSGSDYLNNTFTLRSPTSGSATFAGHSLVLSNNATLAFKTSGTLTIGTSPSTGLFLDNSDVGGWNGSSSTLAGYLTLDADGGTMDPQIFSIINLTTIVGGSGALIVASPSGQYGGTVVLLSSNSYSGGTLVSAIDKLQLSGSGTLGSVNGDLTMNVTQGLPGTGTLDLNGTSQSVGNLAGNTNALILDNAVSTSSTLTVGNGNATGGNFGGVIANGNGAVALTKVGTGTITLSGANTYTGKTLISGGTLALSGSATISGTTPVKIASSATLDVSGLSSPLSLGSGQILTGIGATGIINGSLNLNAGSLVLNYTSGTPTLSVANGTLTMNNNAVTVTNLGPALPAGSYKIVSAGSGGSVAGSVAGSSISVQGGGVAGGLQAGLSINGSELYLTVGSPSFSITNVWNGSSITLSWPGGGQLLQATNLMGPWTTNNSATSPFTVTPTTPQMFYRVQH